MKSISLITNEIIRAQGLYPDYHSDHEAYAVLKEEVDELWDAVKLKQSNPLRNELIIEELIQIAAVAIRYLELKTNKKL